MWLHSNLLSVNISEINFLCFGAYTYLIKSTIIPYLIKSTIIPIVPKWKFSTLLMDGLLKLHWVFLWEIVPREWNI